MPNRQPPVPSIWLVTDARNDALLEASLRRLPRGSGLIYRHYHLDPMQRRARFAALKHLARQRGHRVVLAGSAAQARRWGADGAYGPVGVITRGPALLRLTTAHSVHELRRATRADALLLSPVFPTRSHPGGGVLGAVRFHLIAGHARVPVIALGGMTARRARTHGIRRWAAIDGLAAP